eukprot:104562_1
MNLDEKINECSFIITGSTGFVGLYFLYSILKIQKNELIDGKKKVFVLVRSLDKFKTITVKNNLFTKLDNFDKLSQSIIPIEIDLNAKDDRLGINDTDFELLKCYCDKNNTMVMVHIAGSIAFNVGFNEIMNINANGTFQCINVAKLLRINNFIYTSTVFANSNQIDLEYVKEKLYSPNNKNIDPINIFKEWKHENNKVFSKKQIQSTIFANFGKWPNTYLISKYFAEYVTNHYCKQYGIKYGIARIGGIGPSNDIETYGWYSSLTKCPTLYIYINQLDGNIKMLKTNKQTHYQIIPVNYCTNFLLLMSVYVVNKIIDNGADIGIIGHCVNVSELPAHLCMTQICQCIQKLSFYNKLNIYQRKCVDAMVPTSSKYYTHNSFRFATNVFGRCIVPYLLTINNRKKKKKYKKLMLTVGLNKIFKPGLQNWQGYSRETLSTILNEFDCCWSEKEFELIIPEYTASMYQIVKEKLSSA